MTLVRIHLVVKRGTVAFKVMSFKALSLLESKDSNLHEGKCKTAIHLIVALILWVCFPACLHFPIRNPNIILKGIGPSFSLQLNHPFDCNLHNRGIIRIKQGGKQLGSRVLTETRSNRENPGFCRASEQQFQRLTHISESPGASVGLSRVFLCSGRHRSCYGFRLTQITGPTARLNEGKRVGNPEKSFLGKPPAVPDGKTGTMPS